MANDFIFGVYCGGGLVTVSIVVWNILIKPELAERRKKSQPHRFEHWERMEKLYKMIGWRPEPKDKVKICYPPEIKLRVNTFKIDH